ncbi:hypothetical protein [Carboxylicivirga marina]|uniref:DUF4377 domain-containing protein n=1 Tax=Carboxylicivirga marina TaxID=2800988 RepID=A0ABS1HLC7_9BACT|nr:hypothetical protein [Carboxylicivirga marina]MBK3518484.1 hypothetical protein [Carboxylicivirga marina]
MRNPLFKSLPLLIFFISTAMSCEKEDIEPLNQYRIGVEYSITPDLSFTVENIGDSRCPEGVVCVWEGDVHMDFIIIEGGNTIDTTMNLNYHRNYPSVFGGYTFEIQNVIPYPKYGEEVDPDDIRVVMGLIKQ